MQHIILFTGHMIDAPGRKATRFPQSKEPEVRNEMARRIERAKQNVKTNPAAIAGAACGGDILFHELCLELQIPSEIYLALPIAEFKAESVSFAGGNWGERFDRLIGKLPVHVLPKSVKKKDVWKEANLWMLQETIAYSDDFTLIALWDQEHGDGDGGTEQMVKTAQLKRGRVDIINIKTI